MEAVLMLVLVVIVVDLVCVVAVDLFPHGLSCYILLRVLRVADSLPLGLLSCWKDID